MGNVGIRRNPEMGRDRCLRGGPAGLFGVREESGKEETGCVSGTPRKGKGLWSGAGRGRGAKRSCRRGRSFAARFPVNLHHAAVSACSGEPCSAHEKAGSGQHGQGSRARTQAGDFPGERAHAFSCEKWFSLLTLPAAQGILAHHSYMERIFRSAVFFGVALSMIIDSFERGCRYDLGSLWRALFPELRKLIEQGKALPDGRYVLAGGPEQGGVAVSVETYEPRDLSQARYESHDVFADIQTVLDGDEYLDMFLLHGGEKESMRDAQRDLVFYAEKPAAVSRVHLTPGVFALVLPGEAHMPCLRADSSRVKKLVVKIPAEKLSVPFFG